MIFGQQVRFTANELAIMRVGDHEFIEGEFVHAGDEGMYLGPLSDEGWHLIEVGDYRVVPASSDMFEVVEHTE